ncbi:MAG: DEAD/DEAH box helicase family protein [Deltaproteobacteria bacterium]|jgi:type I restriction enzyme R subunit|nr:DEAD/DEAH box helicase family protein [Deltaproteobacteria bacterium]
MALNESETRAELIDPALKKAGWGVIEGSQIRREFSIAEGRLTGVAGQRHGVLKADYLLIYKGRQLVVLEAKSEDKDYTLGLQQAKDYGQRLDIRFVCSTNGKKIRWVDLITGQEKDIDTYPSPDDVWKTTFPEKNDWRDTFNSIPFAIKPDWSIRYYQGIAVTKAMDTIANGQKRILLTLATGTGKSDIAFQIAWKLFKSSWTLSQDQNRTPRILFLADRNILADQAFNGFSSFNAFSEGALVRIRSEEINKNGYVPQNGSVFFTIFQTLLSGSDSNIQLNSHFKSYSPDFFDVIFIDECHRGGANDESQWRSILEHFKSALQIGLTATPKRTDNVDTYAYFGDPVYIYSLITGINDGYLTPFRLKNYSTSVDNYTLQAGDTVVQGDAEIGQYFTSDKLDNDILIIERERVRVEEFLKNINSKEKTLVFCSNQERALFIRNIFNELKTETDPNYCVRVTSDDHETGEQYLRIFQDNDKFFPTILTTSEKLSTGVDARNVRHIVFLRKAYNIIEFKQIIGRGTRLFHNKDYFTIHDFAQTSELFNDPKWDGDPIEPESEPDKPDAPDAPDGPEDTEGPDNHDDPTETIVIHLSDGTTRSITVLKAISFLDVDGKVINAQDFIIRLFGELPNFFNSEDDLRSLWQDPSTRNNLLAGLANKGFPIDKLNNLRSAIEADKCDIFDVLSYIKFSSQLKTRQERANNAKKTLLKRIPDSQSEFLDYILKQYVNNGFTEFDSENYPSLIAIYFKSLHDGVAALGTPPEAINFFKNIQKELYAH